jgi:hypothetical protein
MNTSITIRPSTLQGGLDSQLDFILLDGSSSMKSKWWEMLGAIDVFVSGLKEARINTRIRLDTFSSCGLEVTSRDCPISEWKTFAEDPIGAEWGGTPLYDAIVIMGRNIRDLNPAKGATILIVTDGENTYNRFADLAQARAILEWLKDCGYNVIFFGCDFNNDSQARALGMTPSNTIGVQKTLLLEAAKSLAAKRAHNARTGADISFTEDERQQFGGFLSHSKGS